MLHPPPPKINTARRSPVDFPATAPAPTHTKTAKVEFGDQPACLGGVGLSESKPLGKSFEIDKWVVWEAFQRVKANKGAAGVDGESIEAFEADRDSNLYKIWNRMSSGTYFPPPVLAVEIPKLGGGVRVLGVPTVADRVAQTVAVIFLEPRVEPIFHQDSYGYRPGRSALDAVGICRTRCWKRDWVIDLDIKSFFDTVPHDLILRAVETHIAADQRWILLYVKRWLQAPLQRNAGLVPRDRGTPQGSAISPLLANLFLHYAFDTWMAREHPTIGFERYCDDMVVHCDSEQQARQVRDAIAARLAGLGVELHPEKTKLVYCKDGKRRGSYEHTSFTFLGYEFRARGSKDRNGEIFTNFLPAVSAAAKKRMSHKIRSWHIGRRTDLTVKELARKINPIVSGWINYYGRFYRSELLYFLRRLNDRLIRWLIRKYKRLHRSTKRARAFLVAIHRTYPGLFMHWRFGAKPTGWTMGAV